MQTCGSFFSPLSMHLNEPFFICNEIGYMRIPCHVGMFVCIESDTWGFIVKRKHEVGAFTQLSSTKRKGKTQTKPNYIPIKGLSLSTPSFAKLSA